MALGTIAQLADYLVDGYWAWSGYQGYGPRHWTPGATLSVNITDLNADQQALAISALNAWHEVSNINFAFTAAAAQLTYNNNGSRVAQTSQTVSGTSLTSSTIQISSNWFPDTSIDSYMYQTYLHETGHALGLGHLGPYNGDASYGVDNVFTNDTWQYSVMSYFEQHYFGGATDNGVITPQMADIAAAQSIYGTTNTRTGNTTYGFNSNAGSIYDFTQYSGAPALTVYDSGGADTLDCSGYSMSQTINLNPETWSSIGGYVNNIGIFTGVSIENAVGGAGNDTLIGSGVSNQLNGGLGADTMSGGMGDDVYYVDVTADVVTEGTSAGTDTVYALATYVLSANVENLRLYGTGAIDGTGNERDNVIWANGGANALNGGDGVDTVSYYYASGAVNASLLTGLVSGGSGADSLANFENLYGSNNYGDTLVGNTGPNVLVGYGGNDSLDGGAGTDTLIGGAGNDVYYIDSGADVVTEGTSAGTDTVYALATYVLSANVENLRLYGTGAIDGTGNERDNVIWANGGVNALNGLAGVDTVSYYYAEAGVNASLLTGLVTGGSGADTLSNFENLYGSNSFGDTLVGNASANVLIGYGGSDSLDGEAGSDQLTGGLGSDTFLFDTALNGTTNVDQIIDFSVADDTIQLENVVFGSLASGPLPAGQFRAAPGAVSAVDADDFLIYDSGSGALYYDADANGATNVPVLFATLSAGLGLTVSDFVVI